MSLFNLKNKNTLFEYFFVVIFLSFISLLSFLANPYIGYRAVGYLYLIAVIVIGFRSTFGPILLASIGGAFIWNFIFIPPKFTIHIQDNEDRMMCLTFIVAGLLAGYLARKTKAREEILILRENNTRILYNLISELAKLISISEICDLAEKSVVNLMDVNIVILLLRNGELESSAKKAIGRPSDQDLALARLCIKIKKSVGWSTNSFSEAKCLALPLIASNKAIGTLLFYPLIFKSKLSLDEESLLTSICLQIATAIEHLTTQNENHEIHLFRESEKLHQTLLNSVSHEMRIPITSIQGNVDALQNEKVQNDPVKVKLIHQDLIQSCQRLNQVIENLLDMNRLDSGLLKLKNEWVVAEELVKTVVGITKSEEHILSICEISKNLLVRCDVKFMEHALLNLVLNAKNYSKLNTEIRIEIDRTDTDIIFRVLDQGTGIPSDKLDLIFNKFYRIPGSPTGGVGLGLSIVKGIAEAHGGNVLVKNRTDCEGALFEIHIPWYKSEMQLSEDLS